jgi:hypothetical protein
VHPTRRPSISLTVPPELVAAAECGHIDDAAFVACAYSLVERLAGELPAAERDFSDNKVRPPDEQTRDQLLRALAGSAIRGAPERRFGVVLAFQNCHRLAAFRAETVGEIPTPAPGLVKNDPSPFRRPRSPQSFHVKPDQGDLCVAGRAQGIHFLHEAAIAHGLIGPQVDKLAAVAL